jgi:hypothetical protein
MRELSLDILAGLSIQESEDRKVIFKDVPKSFTVFPIPSMKWRHISLNGKALRSLTGPGTTPTYQDDRSMFNHFFKMEELGYQRYKYITQEKKKFIDLT